MGDQIKTYGKLIKSAIWASIVLATVLTVGKFAVWIFSGSETMLASFIDSLMDGFGAVITMFAVRFSLEPPDMEHNYGHGKAEAIAGLIQGLIVALTVVLVIWHSIEKLIEPQALQYTVWAIVITALSMLLEFGVICYQHKIINLTKSAAVKADNIHIKADFLFNCGVLLSLVIVEFTGYVRFDSIFAIVLALLILYGAYKIVLTSTKILLDHKLPQHIIDDIKSIVDSTPEIISVHGFRTRQAGKIYFIQMHVVMNDSATLLEVHQVTDSVEDRIKSKYSNVDVIIHVEPFNNAADEEAVTRNTFSA